MDVYYITKEATKNSREASLRSKKSEKDGIAQWPTAVVRPIVLLTNFSGLKALRKLKKLIHKFHTKVWFWVAEGLDCWACNDCHLVLPSRTKDLIFHVLRVLHAEISQLSAFFWRCFVKESHLTQGHILFPRSSHSKTNQHGSIKPKSLTPTHGNSERRIIQA